MAKEIVQEGHPSLRKVSSEVDFAVTSRSELGQIIAEMKESLDSCEDGVALAAPQIGINKRIFVVSPRAYDNSEVPEGAHLVFINPKITKVSAKKVEMDEGCLSVRNVYGKILRAEKASVKAFDEEGQPFSEGRSGLLAEIFQHEIDHLDGVLFIDTAKDLFEIEREKDVKDKKTNE